ncbi:Demethylrebeccamycin-D-glucose O-methyltransferase [bacterium HR16]|nr:Demethylrebeccamycin-D-glucose O-methyltransferase [bacterium HR16]
MDSKVAFDFDSIFNEDYLYFYEPMLTAERSEQEVEQIWNLLRLQPDMQVLDLACGHGRIANRLAQRGCRVTGLDSCRYFLDIARTDALRMGVVVQYVQADMRRLPFPDAAFDSVVNWFTAFGYFDEEGNRRVLTEACRVLRPGGRLLIDTMNRDRLMKEWHPFILAERDGNLMVDINRYNALTGYTENERITIREGKMRRARFSIRLFTYPELSCWLQQAGFASVQGSDRDGQPYNVDSRRMVVVAEKT